MTAPPTLKDILGVDTAAPNLWSLLNPKAVVARNVQGTKAGIPARIPSDATMWVDEMIVADEEVLPLYFQNPPEPASELRSVLNGEKTIKRLVGTYRAVVWEGLETCTPGWLTGSTSVVQNALSFKNTDVLDYLVEHYPRLIRDNMGLAVSRKNGKPGALCISPEVIETSQLVFNFGDWGARNTIESSELLLMGGIWPEFIRAIEKAQQNNTVSKTPFGGTLGRMNAPDQLTGAQALVLLLNGSVDERVAHWLCDRVEEISDYLQGDSTGWIAAIGQSGRQVTPEAPQWLGHWFLENMTSYIYPAYRGVTQPGGKDFYRFWLDRPIMRDEKLFDQLIPRRTPTGSRGIRILPGLDDDWTGRLEFLLCDPQTSEGTTHMMRRYCWLQRASSDKSANLQPPMGLTDEYARLLPKRTDDPALGQPGLAEAVLWHKTGAAALNLFQSDDGIAVIQQILARPLGGYLIQRAGTTMGWRTIEALVEQHSDQWQDWRDANGNSIAHWLSYAANKISRAPTAKSHRDMARKFPDLMTVANNQGYTPTDFMPAKHVEAIAAKLLKKTSKRDAVERKNAVKSKIRTL